MGGRNDPSIKGETTMKKFVLVAAAALAIALTSAPTFAGEGISSQSANIAAGGAAYPVGVLHGVRY
jgi:hypothetical protein